ncbi:uncharacterized protein LOC135470263 isoform X2 [Liolophura sinensis]|uniref:uncharacterized protein LOC135470263 isoform X2 n=1 Tax=Liolophura sinensis TaxID=3198878 RepID=UPI003158B784
MPTCWAIGCSNVQGKAGKNRNKTTSGEPLPENEKLSFHRFPFTKPDLLKQWLQNVGRKWRSDHASSSMCLCSVHFLKDCFEFDTFGHLMLTEKERLKRKRRLKEDAVPTLFAASSSSECRTSAKFKELVDSFSANDEKTKDISPYPVSLFQIIHPYQQSIQKSTSEEINPDFLKTELEDPENHKFSKKETGEGISGLRQPRHTRTSQDVVYFPEPMVPEPECTELEGTSRSVSEALSQTDSSQERANIQCPQDAVDTSDHSNSKTDCNDFPETRLTDAQTQSKQDKETQMEYLGPCTGVPNTESETQQPESQSDNQSSKMNPLFSCPNTTLATTDDIYGIPQKIFVERKAGEPPTEYIAAFVYLPDDKKPDKSKKVLGVDKKGLIYLPRDTYDSIAESGPMVQDSEQDSECEPTEEEKLQHGSYSSKHDHPYCSSRSVSRSVQTKDVPLVPVKRSRRKKKRGRKRKLKTTETGSEKKDMPKHIET